MFLCDEDLLYVVSTVIPEPHSILTEAVMLVTCIRCGY